MLIILGLIVLILISIVLSYFFLIPFFYGAPYEPSRGKALSNIIKFVDPKKGDKIAELGSGDARVCIELAQKGAEVHGFEINPFLVWISRRKIRNLGLQNRIKIYWKSFWKKDLSEYNKIVMFQFNTIANKLSKKFKKELKPKSIIVSHWWKLPRWEIKKKVGRVYLYEV